MSDYIQVFARVKPSKKEGITHVDEGNNTVRVNSSTFTFDGAFGPNSQQNDVFLKCGKHIVESVLDGVNGTIFAYGQTGSGKTYTMNGNDIENAEKKGLVPRCLDLLFEKLNKTKEELGDIYEYEVQCSFIELYNETIYDLLDPKNRPEIRINLKKVASLTSACTYNCTDVKDVTYLIKKGCHNRHVAETKMNRESSRSHSVFIISLMMKREEHGVINQKTSQLNLVDLAGSERQAQSKAEGERLKEATHINKSLSTLGRVIRALSTKATHIPYRDSILTHLLTNSLGGNSRTAFVLTMHSEAANLETTMSTANFANSLKQIKNNAHVNEDVICEDWKREMNMLNQQCKSENAVLNARILELEEQLKAKEELTENLTEDRSQEIISLKDDINTLTLQLSSAEELAESNGKVAKEYQQRLKKITEQAVSLEKYNKLKVNYANLDVEMSNLESKCLKMTDEINDLKHEKELLTEQIAKRQQEDEFAEGFKTPITKKLQSPFHEDSPLNLTEVINMSTQDRRKRRATLFDLREREAAINKKMEKLNNRSIIFDDNGDVRPDEDNDENALPTNTRPASAFDVDLVDSDAIRRLSKINIDKTQKLSTQNLEKLEAEKKKEIQEYFNNLNEEFNQKMMDMCKSFEKRMEEQQEREERVRNTIAHMTKELEETKRQRDLYLERASENMGHKNNKQKIGYIDKLRKDLIDLQNENARLKNN